MADKYISQSGGVEGNDGDTPDTAYAADAITWAAGNTYYLLGIITTAISVGQSGSLGNEIVIRGDYADSPALLDGKGVTNNMLGFNVKNYIDIINVAFDNPSDSSNHQLMYLDRGQVINVTGCTFNNTGNYAGNGLKMYVQAGANGLNIINIDSNYFYDINKTAIVLTNYADQAASTPNRITIKDNSINDCFQAFQYIQDTSGWTQLDGGWIPWGMDIDGNALTNCEWGITQVMWQDGFAAGIAAGYPSYLRNNVLTDIGDTQSEFNNAIQLENCKGGYVESNTVDGMTKINYGGDGHCIILDFKKDSADPAYYTDGVIVRNNILKGANSVGRNNNCSGIRTFRGVNNIIYNNIIMDCLIGMANSGVNSTGNLYYHNTCFDIHERGWSSDQSSAAATVGNNIFSMRDGNYGGMVNDATAVDPVETYNVVFNAAQNTINSGNLHATDVEADPVILEDCRTGGESSARGIGPRIAGYEYDANDNLRQYPCTVGAFEIWSGDYADDRLLRDDSLIVVPDESKQQQIQTQRQQRIRGGH